MQDDKCLPVILGVVKDFFTLSGQIIYTWPTVEIKTIRIFGQNIIEANIAVIMVYSRVCVGYSDALFVLFTKLLAFHFIWFLICLGIGTAMFIVGFWQPKSFAI